MPFLKISQHISSHQPWKTHIGYTVDKIHTSWCDMLSNKSGNSWRVNLKEEFEDWVIDSGRIGSNSYLEYFLWSWSIFLSLLVLWVFLTKELVHIFEWRSTKSSFQWYIIEVSFLLEEFHVFSCLLVNCWEVYVTSLRGNHHCLYLTVCLFYWVKNWISESCARTHYPSYLCRVSFKPIYRHKLVLWNCQDAVRCCLEVI